jgi:acyl carrier protein
VSVRLLALLAAVLERDLVEVASLAPDTPLFGGAGLGLDSLTGMRLLAAIQREFGVDLAAEDLALDCLQTIGTLTARLDRV